MTLNLNVDFCVANAHIVTGLPQRKGIIPNCQMNTEIKYVKDVSCVGHLSSVNLVTNAPPVVTNPPVGARLHKCWEKRKALGSSPKIVTTLREGNTLPFRFRPNLTRSPTGISNYHNPAKQANLLEALYQLVNKNAVEPVENQNSEFLQPAIFGTQTQQPVETYPGPEHLEHLFEQRVVQDGDPRDNKNLRTGRGVGHFHRLQRHVLPHTYSQSVQEVHAGSYQGRSYQFKALPFGLSTAPMEFTVVAKEVKLMALQRGIRIHQYLDDWLVRASSHETCLQHAQTLVVPKQVFNFVGYQFDLKEGKVRPTPEHWQALTDKIQSILSGMPGLTVHVHHRSSHSNRKASPPRATSHEAHTVALEKQLEGPRITRQGHPSPQVAPPPPKVVAGGKQCATRSTFTPSKTCSADIYRRIKRRVGHSLR